MRGERGHCGGYSMGQALRLMFSYIWKKENLSIRCVVLRNNPALEWYISNGMEIVGEDSLSFYLEYQDYNNPSKFKILNIPSKGMNSLRYTIDRENDLKLAQKIVSLIKNRPILTTNIETLFRNDASLFQINSEYQRNAGYFKSIQNEK